MVTATMLQSDFMEHLALKGALRDAQPLDGGARTRRKDGHADIDWVGLTKLTPSAFADELATFYRCKRVQRGAAGGRTFCRRAALGTLPEGGPPIPL